MVSILITSVLFWLPAYLFRQHRCFDQPVSKMTAAAFAVGVWLLSFIGSLLVWGRPNAGVVLAALCAYRTLSKPAPKVA